MGCDIHMRLEKLNVKKNNNPIIYASSTTQKGGTKNEN